MLSDRINYVAVGSFVLAAGIGLVIALALISGYRGATDSYFTVMASVSGVEPGARVLYQGYPIGRVDSIEPDTTNSTPAFRLQLSVDQGWIIPDTSVLHLTGGLLSTVDVDIRSDEPGEPLLPGAEIKSSETLSPFEALSDLASKLSDTVDDSLNPLLSELAERMPEIAENFQELSNDLRSAAARVNEIVSDENAASVERTLANVEQSSSELAALSSEARTSRDKLQEILVRIDALIVENRPAVDESIADLRHSLDSIARRIDAFTYNLESTSRNLDEFSQQIRANPGLLLGGRSPPEDAE